MHISVQRLLAFPILHCNVLGAADTQAFAGLLFATRHKTVTYTTANSCVSASSQAQTQSASTYLVLTPGTADASRSQSVEATIQQRDSDIKAYFDTQVLKHVLNPDHQKRSLALTREICGLKVAHQQLIAAHAAAKKLAGAASLQSVTLRQQLQVSELLQIYH